MLEFSNTANQGKENPALFNPNYGPPPVPAVESQTRDATTLTGHPTHQQTKTTKTEMEQILALLTTDVNGGGKRGSKSLIQVLLLVSWY